MKEGFIERVCYFNLGVCYVVKGDVKWGVEFLFKVFFLEKEVDGIMNYVDL